MGRSFRRDPSPASLKHLHYLGRSRKWKHHHTLVLTPSTPPEDQVQTFSSCGKLGVPRSAQCLLAAWVIQELGRKPYLLEVIPKGQVALNLRKTKGIVVLSTRMLYLLNHKHLLGGLIGRLHWISDFCTSEMTLQPPVYLPIEEPASLCS